MGCYVARLALLSLHVFSSLPAHPARPRWCVPSGGFGRSGARLFILLHFICLFMHVYHFFFLYVCVPNPVVLLRFVARA